MRTLSANTRLLPLFQSYPVYIQTILNLRLQVFKESDFLTFFNLLTIHNPFPEDSYLPNKYKSTLFKKNQLNN